MLAFGAAHGESEAGANATGGPIVDRVELGIFAVCVIKH